MSRHPLAPKDARRAGSDLAKLSKAYAKRAAYHGAKGPWWRVWRAIERARGHDLRAAIATLNADGRRWYAKWSFARDRAREGRVIYRTYLAAPGEIGPFDSDNAVYLRSVAPNADTAAILREADALNAKTSSAHDEVEGVVLEALLDRGAKDALAARYAEPGATKQHDGAAWARHAIALAKSGDRARAEAALETCAKLGLGRRDTLVMKRLLETFGLDESEWSARTGAHAPAEDFAARWKANPPLRVEPTQDDSPHAFGGDDFTMPACPGCGHAMHAFFTIDVAAVDDLRARIPSWPKLPLVGCIDCCLWLVRRDFAIDHTARRVDVIGVAASGEQLASLGKPYSTLAPIARQPIALRRPKEDELGTDRTQIGGEPDWVQDDERVICPRCRDAMRFVAALGTTWRSGLVPEITINNGSGYQYHFACDRCAVLSVFGQNT